MMHPRRLKGSPANIARYYSVGDYYSKSAHEHSEWGGRIALDLGLSGAVDPVVLRELLAGRVAGQQLGRRRSNGEIEHHPGWDFAINAPKSVSIMALVAGDERIIAAHERAVGTALGYLEEHAGLRRRDSGEVVHETTGRLIIARFTEHASRELDPHLHTHAVVMNMTNHEPGAQMASLETRAMYAEQMVAGQVYRNELARDLRALGYEIDARPRSGLFEIRGVPSDLIRMFSQRAEQIEAHAKEHGLSGQSARRKSFYATRPPKVKQGLESLHQEWSERSKAHAPVLENVLAKSARTLPDIEVDRGTAARAALFGIRQAETNEAVNNLGRMIRIGLAGHVGEVRLDDLASVPIDGFARSRSSAVEEREIARCIGLAADGRPWLERTLWGLRDQEGGWLGAAVLNANGSHDLGPLQINSWWVPRIASLVGRPVEHVRDWLRRDACFNAATARWIFLTALAESRDYWKAVGIYHSPTQWRQRSYAASVASKLEQRFGSAVFSAREPAAASASGR